MSALTKLIGTRVKVYRNLNNGQFSVKTDKVQGYTTDLTLSDVKFTGGHSKAQKDIQNGAPRSVHAYAVGTLVKLGPSPLSGAQEVTYRPKERAGFYIRATGKEVTSAGLVFFANNKMYCIDPK
jgi:hypothetical protein